MSGKHFVSVAAMLIVAAFSVSFLTVEPVDAYRICTFKGTVIDHGWRTMTVKSGNQCAEVNVGWRTKYLPNRRPCLGERVAVDFQLEDGYMKATKVVSLSPLPPSVRCYPPPPPPGTRCRSVGEEALPPESCARPKPICSTKPPAYVSEKAWTPTGEEPGKKAAKPVTEKTQPEAKKPGAKKVTKVPEGEKEPKEKPAGAEEKKYETISGEVVASSPRSIAIRVAEEGEAAEVITIKVGLKTKFVPFRRPAVGERVKVDYLKENGEKFGYTVQVVQ